MSFVDNPRHSNRPPVIPTAHPSFRRRPESRGAGTWGIPLITKITRITVQTTPFAPLVSFVDNPRHSNRPPVIPAAGRNPEGRGGGTSHESQKSHESQFRQLPSRPLVSFVDNPRHSNRPPVIPTAHPSFRRRPESRGARRRDITPITKITRITVQTKSPLDSRTNIPYTSHSTTVRQPPNP